MLDFANETFNKVAFFVEMPIIISLLGAVFARWNNRYGATVKDT